jgi:hypothetical protein
MKLQNMYATCRFSVQQETDNNNEACLSQAAFKHCSADWLCSCCCCCWVAVPSAVVVWTFGMLLPPHPFPLVTQLSAKAAGHEIEACSGGLDTITDVTWHACHLYATVLLMLLLSRQA